MVLVRERADAGARDRPVADVRPAEPGERVDLGLLPAEDVSHWRAGRKCTRFEVDLRKGGGGP